MAGGSTERQSMLGQLRMISAAGAEEVYGYERWEGLRLATGSASLALRMAADLGDRRAARRAGGRAATCARAACG